MRIRIKTRMRPTGTASQRQRKGKGESEKQGTETKSIKPFALENFCLNCSNSIHQFIQKAECRGKDAGKWNQIKMKTSAHSRHHSDRQAHSTTLIHNLFSLAGSLFDYIIKIINYYRDKCKHAQKHFYVRPSVCVFASELSKLFDNNLRNTKFV